MISTKAPWFDTFNANAQKLELARLDNMPAAVLAFMAAFDQPVVYEDTKLTEADFELARKLMDNEINEEMWPALEKYRKHRSMENRVELADALTDSIYVILWTMLKMGMPVDLLFAEVQRSNMAKLQPDGSCLKNEAGKVQKPAGWTPPNLHEILVEHRDAGLFDGNRRKDA